MKSSKFNITSCYIIADNNYRPMIEVNINNDVYWGSVIDAILLPSPYSLSERIIDGYRDGAGKTAII